MGFFYFSSTLAVMTFTEILEESRRLVQAGDRFTTADITFSANRALERAVSLIRDSQGRWQWDDSNNTDFPRATRAVTAGRNDYDLDQTHYRIERVEARDTNGEWRRLIPYDQKDVEGSLTEFTDDTGFPLFYDKVGNSLIISPSFNFTDTGDTKSLKVFYERGASYFATTDTSKAPGFNPLFHELIPLWCAYDYAFINGKEIKDDLLARIGSMEEQLKDYYALRDRDEHVRLTAKQSNFK